LDAVINLKSIKVQINLFLAAFAVFLYLKEPCLAFLKKIPNFKSQTAKKIA